MFHKIILCVIMLFVYGNLASSEYERTDIQLSKYDHQEIDCLAKNIYFESRGEPEKGQIAVGLVTMNRAKQEHWPNSVCKVVQQQYKSTCQFSWWCTESLRNKAISNRFLPQEKKLLDNARQIATWIYMNEVQDFTKGATFFHTTYVRPGWKNVVKTVQIGQHLFYRRKQYETS